MKRFVCCLMLGLAPIAAVIAQDAPANDPYPSLLLCEDGQGCRHSPISGEMSFEDASLVLGEEPPDGGGIVVCSASGCAWGTLPEGDVDLVFGGDGTPDGAKTMTFDEPEAEPDGFDFTEEQAEPDGFDFTEDEADAEPDGFDFTEDEADAEPDGFDFTEDELGLLDVTPLNGSWNSLHAAGAVDCPGAFSMAIPASDPEIVAIAVADGGSSFQATNLDPDAPLVDFVRVGPGLYHNELSVDSPEGPVTVNFDIAFVDPALAVGMISSETAMQGIVCTVERGFTIMHESLDLMPESAEPVDPAADSEPEPASENVS